MNSNQDIPHLNEKNLEDIVSENDEFCTQNEELCMKNE